MMASRIVSTSRLKLFAPAVAVLAVVAVCQSAYLVRVNLAYKARLQEMGVEQSILRPRDDISQVSGVDRLGRLREIAMSTDAKAMIFTIAADCAACDASMDGYRRLASEAAAVGVRPVWLSRDPVSSTVASSVSRDLVGDLIMDPTYRTWMAAKLAVVPQAAIVSDGKVMAAWTGALSNVMEEEMSVVLKGK